MEYPPETLPAVPPGGVTCGIDWANDDQPYLIGRGDRPLVSLPLMQEISDVNLHWNRRVTLAHWAALVAVSTPSSSLPSSGRDPLNTWIPPMI